MISIGTYWWTDPSFEMKRPYTADNVRLLAAQAARHCSVPHEFVCITDQPHEFEGDPAVRAVPLNRATHVPGTCFVRLFTFSASAVDLLGSKVLLLDLDSLIVGSLDSIVARDADLVMWRNPGRVPWENPAKQRPYYNTSVVMHRPGTRIDLWKGFDPLRPRYRDDQWYLSDVLGPNASYFDGSDGIYRLARVGEPGTGVWGELPQNARIVTFPGSEGKWHEEHIAAANPWIAEHRKRV